MNSSPSEQPEAARIRSVYKRRSKTNANRYSLFDRAYFLLELELQQATVELLMRFHFSDVDSLRVLDVGCANGRWLRYFIQWGARPENLHGIDLMQERIEIGKSLCPASVTLGATMRANFALAIRCST